MSSPDTSDVDASDVPGPASSNLTLLYIIVAVIAGVLLYLAVRYGRSLISEWRALHGHGAGDGAPTDAHLGLSADEIAALPTFTYRARAAPSPSPQGSWGGGKRRSGSKGRSASAMAAVECVVCLQELEDGDVVRVLPACRHFFHGSCIDAWLRAHSSCPVCRAHPEPDRARPSMSPPLPQLRPCDVSPERPTTATMIFADILARSPLRIGGSASTLAAKENRVASSRSPSPAPMVRDYVLSRSPSRTPLTHGAAADERWSSQSPQTLEVVVVRSPSPMRFGRQSTTTCVGVLEPMDASMSPSPSPPATYALDSSSSKLSPQLQQ